MAGTKPIVALDLDGVLYRWTEAACGTFHALRGIEIPDYGEDTHWNHIKEFISDDDWHWLWNDPQARRRCMGTGRAYADGLRAAKELEEISRVVILTSRPSDTIGATMMWIVGHELFPHALIQVAPPQRKAEHEILEHALLLVDDNPDNCREARDICLPVFCPARAYNTELEGEKGIFLFDDWADVINYVREAG